MQNADSRAEARGRPLAGAQPSVLVNRALDDAADAVIVTDAASEVVTWNAAAELLFGISRVEAVGKPIAELFDSSLVGADPADTPRPDVLAGRSTWRGRVVDRPRLGPRAGNAIVVDLVLGEVKDPDGRVVGRVGINRDVTAEARLEAQLSRLGSLASAEGGPASVEEIASRAVDILTEATWASLGAIVLVEPGGIRIAAERGMSPVLRDALEGLPIDRLPLVASLAEGTRVVGSPVEVLPLHQSTKDALAASGIGWVTVVGLREGPTVRGVMALGWPSPPLNPPTDATVLQAAAQVAGSIENAGLIDRLALSEERYRTLFEQSPDALLVETLDGFVVDANPAAARLFRQDREALVGLHVQDIAEIDDVQLAEQRATVMRAGRATFASRGRRPDGTTFPQEVELTRIDVGSEARLLVLVRDVAESQRVHAELLQAQKMEAIGQLVAGVAHELNNPLAAIIAFSQLIRRDVRLPDDMRHDADLLTQEADRTRRIVQNLLDFARQRPPERYPTSIRTLVESVLSLQSYSIGASLITVDLDVPADLPAVWIDRAQMQQVVLNLTLNAIQAIRGSKSSGRIQITARQVEGEPEVGPSLRLSIVDDGPGVAPEHRSRLFIPFFTTKEPGDGTGLGLSVSFGILAAHGGRLEYEPGPGGTGAAFVMELPIETGRNGGGDDPIGPEGSVAVVAPAVSAATVGESPPGESPTTDSRATARVLVLDDEPSIRAFLARVLASAGYEGVIASDGPEAIDEVRAGDFAAILCDHRMAGMTGTEVYEAIVALRPELARRFVFMSGDVLNPELRGFASERGIALLAKPFDIDTVRRTVHDVVEASQRG